MYSIPYTVLHIRAAGGCAHVILELSVLRTLETFLLIRWLPYFRIESVSELSFPICTKWAKSRLS